MHDGNQKVFLYLSENSTGKKMQDPYDLQRFLDAQERSFEKACQELSQGHKESHWMWYIFPQLRGLGGSAMSNRYGISGSAEAQVYLEHPVLGPRLRRCTELVVLVKDRSIDQIFEDPDDLKFRSCMTLFSTVAEKGSIFSEALKKYFGGKPDERTIARL